MFFLPWLLWATGLAVSVLAARLARRGRPGLWLVSLLAGMVALVAVRALLQTLGVLHGMIGLWSALVLTMYLSPEQLVVLVWLKRRFGKAGQPGGGFWAEVSDDYWWHTRPRPSTTGGVRTELEAADAPAGRGTEPEASAAPAGRGSELEPALDAADGETDADGGGRVAPPRTNTRV